jgi:hypothetical protein
LSFYRKEGALLWWWAAAVVGGGGVVFLGHWWRGGVGTCGVFFGFVGVVKIQKKE